MQSSTGGPTGRRRTIPARSATAPKLAAAAGHIAPDLISLRRLHDILTPSPQHFGAKCMSPFRAPSAKDGVTSGLNTHTEKVELESVRWSSERYTNWATVNWARKIIGRVRVRVRARLGSHFCHPVGVSSMGSAISVLSTFITK